MLWEIDGYRLTVHFLSFAIYDNFLKFTDALVVVLEMHQYRDDALKIPLKFSDIESILCDTTSVYQITF